MKCVHLNGYDCSLGLCGGRPARSCCFRCDKYDGPARGAGDLVRKVTEATGIHAVVSRISGTDCGCSKRQEALNRLLPAERLEDSAG